MFSPHLSWIPGNGNVSSVNALTSLTWSTGWSVLHTVGYHHCLLTMLDNDNME